jgi:hypothetical protein
MRRLTFVLKFHRAPKPASGPEQPTIATSLRITTLISPAGVNGALEKIEGEAATMETTAQVNQDGNLFFENGTLTFGNAGSVIGTLKYSSLGTGYLTSCPEANFNAGTVMWKIDGGTGFFANATGNITSNFLIDLNTDELIDHHFYLVHLP